MKKILFPGLLLLTAFFSKAQTANKLIPACEAVVTINPAYSKAATLDSIMKYYTTDAMPGISVAVYSEDEGWWAGTAGYANVEKKIPMQNCHLQYLQSVSKSYMAVEILQLKEQGKIELDAPITKYLPLKYSKYVKNADKITVRNLLNHTSGIPEYNENPQFISQVVEHPLTNFTAVDCLKAISETEPLFTPGE